MEEIMATQQPNDQVETQPIRDQMIPVNKVIMSIVGLMVLYIYLQEFGVIRFMKTLVGAWVS
jgi:hypothetical protein